MFSTPGGHHEYTGGCSVHREDNMINVGKVFGETTEFVWKPQCAEHPPLYS